MQPNQWCVRSGGCEHQQENATNISATRCGGGRIEGSFSGSRTETDAGKQGTGAAKTPGQKPGRSRRRCSSGAHKGGDRQNNRLDPALGVREDGRSRGLVPGSAQNRVTGRGQRLDSGLRVSPGAGEQDCGENRRESALRNTPKGV